MKRVDSFRGALVASLLCTSCASPSPLLPEPSNVSQSVGIMINMLWLRSSVVATGNLSRIAREGHSIDQGSVKLYPCSGHFQIQRLIKGDEAMSVKRLLWYSRTEDCTTTGPFGLALSLIHISEP